MSPSVGWNTRLLIELRILAKIVLEWLLERLNQNLADRGELSLPARAETDLF